MFHYCPCWKTNAESNDSCLECSLSPEYLRRFRTPNGETVAHEKTTTIAKISGSLTPPSKASKQSSRGDMSEPQKNK